MPKRKIRQSNLKKADLEAFLNIYPIETLRGSLLSFEASTGWELMKAYMSFVQRQYEIAALDMIGKEERDPRAAAYASGYAKALDEMQDKFVEGLHQTILGRSQVVEVPRPEE